MNFEPGCMLESSGELEREKEIHRGREREYENKWIGMISRPHFRAVKSDSQVWGHC